MRRKSKGPYLHRQGVLQLGTCLFLCFGTALAGAAEPPQAVRYVIEQPSQGLAEALRAIARQTNTSVLFEPGTVAGRVAKPVSGRLSPIEAITAALKGTGLTAEQLVDGAVLVKPGPTSATPPAGSASSGASLLATSGARSTPSSAALTRDGDGAKAANEPSFHNDERPRTEELTRVEVTGSRLKRIEAEGPAPVNVYTRQDIERSGQPNLERFLSALTEVSMSSGEGGFAGTLGQGTVQLRGLPLGSTLVLINGRRVQAVGSSSGNFFNLNLIPMAAVERVEVVPMGSSAVYGGDALAGVVNVILKKSLDGLSVSAKLGSGRSFSDGSVAVAAGRHSAEASYLAMASYSRSSPLSLSDRPFLRDADYRRVGGTDERLDYCAPGTVSSANGTNLPGLNASFAAIPDAKPGQTLSVSDFQSTAGTRNLCNVYATGGGVALVHGFETLGLHALAEHRLAGSWSAFAEGTLAKERMRAEDLGLLFTNVLVPATNAFNPFGVDVRVTAALGPENGTQGFSRQTQFTRVLLGLRGELGAGWDAELTGSTVSDRATSQTWNYTRNTPARTAALASASPETALNLFTGGRAASDAVLRGIWSDRLRESSGRKDQLGGHVRGTLVELPAGPVEAIVGAEVAHDRFQVTATVGAQSHEYRRSAAAYGELRAPLLRAGPAGSGGWDLAALTLAGRRDRYNDFGSASTYQAGLEVRPARTLLIRASSADSFKPPTMPQMNVTETVFDAASMQLVDPARGGVPITAGTVVSSTNQDLGPERGIARSVGAVWEPEGGLGTRLSATHWQVSIRGMIASLRPQSALDYEALFPGFVTRAPGVNGQPGVVTSVRYTDVNFGRLDTAGTDVDAAYGWRTAAGRWTVGAGATRTSEYRVLLAPGALVDDRLGRRFDDFWAPRWKGRLSLGLDTGAWSAGLTSRYLGRYRDSGTKARPLGDYWLHDFGASMNLKKVWPGLVSDVKAATVGLSVANLADRAPQFLDSTPYYDYTQADWRGRYLSLRVSIDW